MDVISGNGNTLTRGEWVVVHTVLLFVNDNEESVINFRTEHGRAIIKLSFDPQKLATRPIVHTAPVREENYIRFVFRGWNTPLAYSALVPTKFASIGKNELAFSACNTYLDGTNKLELQFYSRCTDEQ